MTLGLTLVIAEILNTPYMSDRMCLYVRRRSKRKEHFQQFMLMFFVVRVCWLPILTRKFILGELLCNSAFACCDF